ncbi:MAG: hypothetical protein ACRDZ3_20815 [Acidimicrobiia bacterium]
MPDWRSTLQARRDGATWPPGPGYPADLSAFEGESISLTATEDAGVTLALSDETAQVVVEKDEGAGVVSIFGAVAATVASDVDGSVFFSPGGSAVITGQDDSDTRKLGFWDATPIVQPEIPATPDAQDIADALVALGLITQASWPP